ncbi:MAG: hypothetical protein M3Y50_03905, partial [Acidobacteriota bacterium]|nr:hypothetical protein [Acidobacteriota bacterium]
LAALSLFAERLDHLQPWFHNLEKRALRRRKHEYRTFAAYFLDGIQEIRLPSLSFTTRYMTDKQRAAAPSELLNCLKWYAMREGVQVVTVAKARKEEANQTEGGLAATLQLVRRQWGGAGLREVWQSTLHTHTARKRLRSSPTDGSW